MKIGRNDPCHCGSGKKYKSCCEGKAAAQGDWSKKGMIVAAAALVLGLGGFGISLFDAATSDDGRVWSAEHGHWHNADGSELGAPVAVAPSAPAPQPPGPVPEGKVWSAEHGHWHDAATGGEITVEPVEAAAPAAEPAPAAVAQ